MRDNHSTFDVDWDAVIGVLVVGALLVSILVGLGAMVYADATQQCWGPAFDSYRYACVHGHAVIR